MSDQSSEADYLGLTGHDASYYGLSPKGKSSGDLRDKSTRETRKTKRTSSSSSDEEKNSSSSESSDSSSESDMKKDSSSSSEEESTSQTPIKPTQKSPAKNQMVVQLGTKPNSKASQYSHGSYDWWEDMSKRKSSEVQKENMSSVRSVNCEIDLTTTTDDFDINDFLILRTQDKENFPSSKDNNTLQTGQKRDSLEFLSNRKSSEVQKENVSSARSVSYEIDPKTTTEDFDIDSYLLPQTQDEENFPNPKDNNALQIDEKRESLEPPKKTEPNNGKQSLLRNDNILSPRDNDPALQEVQNRIVPEQKHDFKSDAEQHKEMKKPKRLNWSLAELKVLIPTATKYKLFELGDDEIKPSKLRKEYNKMSNKLAQANYSRTFDQIHKKIKTLRENLKNPTEDVRKKDYYTFLHNTVVLKQNIEDEVSEKEDEGENQINHWSEQETEDLLTFCLERKFFEIKDSTSTRNREVYKAILNDMTAAGYSKTYEIIVRHISKLRTEFLAIDHEKGKSGAAGLKYLTTRTYFPKMQELFGQRPKSTFEGVDSINTEKILNESITRDNEVKKSARSDRSNISKALAPIIQESRKFEQELFEKGLERDEKHVNKILQGQDRMINVLEKIAARPEPNMNAPYFNDVMQRRYPMAFPPGYAMPGRSVDMHPGTPYFQNWARFQPPINMQLAPEDLQAKRKSAGAADGQKKKHKKKHRKNSL